MLLREIVVSCEADIAALPQTGRLSQGSKGVWATVCWLYQSEGVAGLYRCAFPCVCSQVPVALAVNVRFGAAARCRVGHGSMPH
jgi:hypothetical protein